jgi:hypothetical protein
MAVPTISSVSPATGPSGGLDLVRVTGTNYAAAVAVTFGGEAATVVHVHASGGAQAADVRAPGGPRDVSGVHFPGAVDVVLQNLDGNGDPIGGEVVTAVDAYTYERTDLADESDLTRVVRQLLRDLKRGLLVNTNLTVAVDWDYGTPGEVLRVTLLDAADLPALTLSGPEIEEAREYEENEPIQQVVDGPDGPEVHIGIEPYIANLVFDVIGAANSSVQLLNLTAGLVRHLHRYNVVTIPNDPGDPTAGESSFDLDPIGTHRTRLRGGKDDIRAVTWQVRVRGFPIDDGSLIRDVTRTVDVVTLGVEGIPL